MVRRWLIVLAVCCSLALALPVAAVSPPALAWNATFGGTEYDEATAVDQTTDGGYVVAGTTTSNQSGDVGLTQGSDDYWVVKLDDAGRIVWNRTLGGNMTDIATAVDHTSDGGCIVAGTTTSNQSGDVGLNHGYSDYWVVKLDGAGQKVWTATLGGSGYDDANAVQQTTDGGYVVAGTTQSSQSGDVGLNHGRKDFWVVKLDGAGQKVWNVTLGGSGKDDANAVDQTTDGGYVVAGYTVSSQDGDVGFNHGGTDFWVVKLDGAGKLVWNATLGGSGYEEPMAVRQASDGGCVVVGDTDSNQSGDVGLNHGGKDGWVVKLDGAGQKVWNVTLGGSGYEDARAVDRTGDGGYIVAGSTYSSMLGDYLVVKLDGAGQKVWNATFGGSGNDEASAVRQASDGGYVVAGSTTSSGSGDVGLDPGGKDYWVLKLRGESGPAVLAVPPGAALPADTNADGLYDDVNGNGRKDFADIVLFFNQMTWIASNEPVALFDYNGNGRIDFADVVWLFNHL